MGKEQYQPSAEEMEKAQGMGDAIQNERGEEMMTEGEKKGSRGREETVKAVDELFRKKEDHTFLSRAYFGKNLYFDEERNLHMYEYGDDKDSDFDGIEFTAKELESLNEDDGKEIIGDFKTLYLSKWGHGSDYGNSIVESKELAEESVPDESYANPGHFMKARAIPFKLALSKKGNPVVDIEGDHLYSLGYDNNYRVYIHSGVITPDVALVEGCPGYLLREELIYLVKKYSEKSSDDE